MKSSPRGALRLAGIWVLGWLLATAIVWLVCPYFMDSIAGWEKDETVGLYTRASDQVFRWRSEGWANTDFGKYCIAGVEDITQLDRPVVALWGDSYVEALQVNDEEKMAQQVGQLWQDRHEGQALNGVGIGFSGHGLSDYYFMMPRYESLITPAYHFIILGNINDVLPDGKHFVGQPDYKFKERKFAGNFVKVSELAARLHLHFLYHPAKRLYKAWREGERLRFTLGPVKQTTQTTQAKSPPSDPDATAKENMDAMRFALETLQAQTEHPVVIVYLPRVPFLARGSISYKDQWEELAGQLATVCKETGIGFINLREKFISTYEATGQLPRGFHNGRPSGGHINALGHRLVAEAICEYMEQASDAVHTD